MSEALNKLMYIKLSYLNEFCWSNCWRDRWSAFNWYLNENRSK